MPAMISLHSVRAVHSAFCRKMFRSSRAAAQGRNRTPRKGGGREMAHDHYISRRSLLTTLAAAGATTLLPGRALQAQPAPANRHLIDTHHHYYPAEIINGWQDYLTRHAQGNLPSGIARWTARSSLDEMDKSGVATSILSLASIPGV